MTELRFLIQPDIIQSLVQNITSIGVANKSVQENEWHFPLIFQLIWWIFHFVLGFGFWQLCFNCLKPCYVALDDMGDHHVGEQLLRIVTFCHACMCSLFFLGYIFGLISFKVMTLGRIYSTAFFVFDMIQVSQIYNRLQYLHLEDQMKNPLITLFHHTVTIFLCYGFMFQGKLTGLVLFYMAEVAMLPVLMTWRYIHINQEASLECAICRAFEIFLYGILRVVMIPPLFVTRMLPFFQYDKFLAWIFFAAYILVYALNVLWFLQMTKGTSEHLVRFARNTYGPMIFKKRRFFS